MVERTKYQQNIIRNYYENQDQILLTRLQEAVTDLYLADNAKAKAKLWKNAAAAMEKMKIPASRIENLTKQGKPELLAKLVEELLSKQ